MTSQTVRRPTNNMIAACVGKLAYDSNVDARRTLRFLQKRGRAALSVYRCKMCDKFHIGNGKRL